LLNWCIVELVDSTRNSGGMIDFFNGLLIFFDGDLIDGTLATTGLVFPLGKTWREAALGFILSILL
jgi:hypothetical protein